MFYIISPYSDLDDPDDAEANERFHAVEASGAELLDAIKVGLYCSIPDDLGAFERVVQMREPWELPDYLRALVVRTACKLAPIVGDDPHRIAQVINFHLYQRSDPQWGYILREADWCFIPFRRAIHEAFE